LIELNGDAPVPPLSPLISTRSDLPFDTPAATVPTPTSETSFTETAVDVGVLQVVDELRQVFDRIDVVVRRRRNQFDARRRIADLAISSNTLWPGNWPPSPGLAPCAILICSSSELTRYSLVTPNRPDATCLIALRRRSPFGSGSKRCGVFAAFARVAAAADAVHGDGQVSCASLLIEP
jgi:hypothetical protein